MSVEATAERPSPAGAVRLLASSRLVPRVLLSVLEKVIAVFLPARSHDSVYPRKSAPLEDTVVFWPVVSGALSL